MAKEKILRIPDKLAMRYLQAIPDLEGGDGASTEHVHHWVVFSTAIREGALMLECVVCGSFGTVDDPSKQEWSKAFDAPSKPYRWHDGDRVTVRGGPQP